MIGRRKRKDPVTPELRDFILNRDKECLAHKLDPEHVCRDTFGNPHSPYDLWRLSLEHVKSELRIGRRAPSDPRHLVALCYALNDRVPSKAEREAFRSYLARVNGDVS